MGKPETNSLQPGFMVLQGNRLEALRQLLVDWTRRQPLAPLENEMILVQSNGIAQWLKLALAADEDRGGLGIAAALDVQLPGRFLWQAYRAVLGDALPERSPYDKSPLTWRIMRLLPELLQEPEFAPLRRFLRDDQGLRKQHQLAEKLADLFDQYQVYRADWLATWEQGLNQLPVFGQSTVDGPALPHDQLWQPALWRRLVADIEAEAETDTRSRAQVHRDFLRAAEALTADNRPSELPRRVIIFGLSSLPRQTLDVLAALVGSTQILLCVHNPCQVYWGDIIEGRDLFRIAYRRQTAPGVTPDLGDAHSLHTQAHPLLAAWGRQGRDYLRLLDEHDERQAYEPLFQAEQLAIDLFEPPNTEHLLGQLQDDILNLRPLPESLAKWPAVDTNQDHSLVFHGAHSAQREIEILHDQLRAALDADSTLNPRDILVMVPDIDQYAPYIRAVFGRLDRDDPRFIPFTLSDQGQRRQQPVLLGLDRLLSIDELRLTVTDLLDLLDIPALRARFGLDADSVPTLQRWIHGANIRWGLHQQHRDHLGLGAAGEQNSWLFGLRRMLLGYMAGDQSWQSIEPYDEIGGLEAALVGALDRLLERLERQLTELAQPASPAQWAQRLSTLQQDLFLPVDEQDTRLLAQLDSSLETWLEDCHSAGMVTELPATVVREAVLSPLDQPSLTQRFMAGAVNFATLMPMRAIPFRRICLLGMNDGDYPRPVQRPDFDLMRPGAVPDGNDYRPGDRSRREDDRYLFLEALLSAREQLYISWIARSVRDNAERPPSVLVGQLRDHLRAGWQAKDDWSITEALTTLHPLQPFSRQYFRPDANPPPAVFTYASEWAAARVDGAPNAEAPDQALPLWLPDRAVTLNHLSQFLRQPASLFFSLRLGTQFGFAEAPVADSETFALDGLSRWQLNNRLLTQVQLDQKNSESTLPQQLDAAVEHLRGSGDLPLPPFDQAVTEGLATELLPALEAWQTGLAESEPLAPGEIRLQVPGPDNTDTEVVLEDWLSDLRLDHAGQGLRQILQPSQLYTGDTLKWYHLIRYWPAHLAAQLIMPTHTRLLGPGSDLTLEPIAATQAEAWLKDQLSAWAEALQTPMPLPCRTGFDWLLEPNKAAQTYQGGYQRRGEAEESEVLRRLWPDYGQLLEQTEFSQLAERLYKPLQQTLRPRQDDGDRVHTDGGASA
ncbi:MAG: exodeoxyribonuclease V subunit gamma [Natronospirillum sp.]|uniref:exodeoxyribonuclease V subunit gamma n=1 Tax=Natronospirillum sp. TaxID=2812955 RepID=UPI0025FE8FE6|nr:exodeoxyribonuclease V subunit gamma [Natronospirillum sp.]MCH8552660.1 exodeoxyribonuclease V subunit gamma [Natronospirillum sp.]